MKIRDVITESASTNLLVVDVQPEYDVWCKAVLPGIRDLISRSKGELVLLYNDFGGGDSAEDVYNYIGNLDELEYDEDDEPVLTSLLKRLQQAQYLQKEYGFLRPMMDMEVSARTIIQVLRLMYQNRVTDSRDLDYDLLPIEAKHELESNPFDWDNEGIFIQDWVPVSRLKQLSPFYIVGGGRDECLREIELICNAFNIRYKRIDSLIY